MKLSPLRFCTPFNNKAANVIDLPKLLYLCQPESIFDTKFYLTLRLQLDNALKDNGQIVAKTTL